MQEDDLAGRLRAVFGEEEIGRRLELVVLGPDNLQLGTETSECRIDFADGGLSVVCVARVSVRIRRRLKRGRSMA